jgi:hypothetical protein
MKHAIPGYLNREILERLVIEVWLSHMWVVKRTLTIDATVGTVCAAALLLSLVHLDVGDEEVVDIQTLHLRCHKA